jgi:hypothetical protein
MLMQTAHLNPAEVVKSLQEEVRNPQCIGRDNILMSFSPRGPFGSMAINRYLYKHTIGTQVYYQALPRTPETYHPGMTKQQFLESLQQAPRVHV